MNEKENTIAQEPEIKKTDKNVTIFNFLLILAIFVGLFVYMIKVDGIENILYLLQNVDYIWVVAGVACLLGVWFCDSVTLHIPLKEMYPKQTLTNSIKVTMIGQLFNNITPFASGGQPMQAYELTKTGKRVSDSLSVLAMKFIITQMALIVFTVCVLVFQFNFFITLFQDYLWIVILGFGLNIVAIIAVILMGVKPSIIKAIVKPFIFLFHKMRIIKHPDHVMEKLEESIANFSLQFKTMKSHKKTVAKIFLVALIQSLFYYSITYMVYRAFGNAGTGFFQIVTVQSFLLLIMTFIPTPGSGLGAEGGFLLLFSSIFSKGTIHMSILFWRMYTFYLPIIVGSLFLIPSKKKRSPKLM